jgi:RNA polymerase sigma factor (sigma-70 family)
MANQSKQKLTQIVREYGNRLFGFIKGKTSSTEDAEDVLQEVWFQLSRVVNIEDIDQMSGWLFKVARNKIIDKHRKKKPQSFDGEEEEADSLIKQILLTETNDFEDNYLKELFWQELFAALEELPENQRQVFIWNELEDMTLKQIAEKTGDNPKTIISRKGYAIKHLRKKLTALYDEFFDNEQP